SRDEGDEGGVVCGGVQPGRTRDHDQMIFRIEAEFIGSGRSADIDELAGAQNILSGDGIEYPHLPWAISDPKLGHTAFLMHGQHAIGPGEIVSTRIDASKNPMGDCCNAVITRIDDVDLVVAAVSQEISVKPWIKPADIERNQRVCTGPDSGCQN